MSGLHHLGLAEARIIETRELQLAEQAVSDLVVLEAMGVLHGPAGSGKTFAARIAAPPRFECVTSGLLGTILAFEATSKEGWDAG